MAKASKNSRMILIAATILLIAGALTAAFLPKPTLVDIGMVTKGPMTLTINEQGRTRVSNAYVVSTPVAGQLQRVVVEPGDVVVRGETIVAHMRPTNPAALDARTREQAQAAVNAAEAALRVARADMNAAMANRDLAITELDRVSRLVERGISSPASLDSAEQRARVAQANVDTAKAAISMRVAEIANAQAQLIGFDDRGLAAAVGEANGQDIAIPSPASGRILRVIQTSETAMATGMPIMEIGNIEDDLEVVVQLLSTDAVQVDVGSDVKIVDWGGENELKGRVVRIDPFGTTRLSALGVEEQRVNVAIEFESPFEDRSGLGHGFRVEAQIIVWQETDAIIVPSSALFRVQNEWAAFSVDNGNADLRYVDLGPNNGIQAQVVKGLDAGDRVILYPSSGLSDGSAVAERIAK